MTSEPNIIRGKVARILNSRELALNVGLEHGVKPSMLFDVLDPTSENISDPDTGAIIGSVYRPKVRVKIVQIETKISVATTYRSKRVNIGGKGLGAWEDLFTPRNWIREYETLRTEEGTWEGLDEKNSYVATGDPVVQIIHDEDED